MADINIHSLHAYLGSHFDGRHLQSRNNLNFCYFLDKFTHNVKVSPNQGQKCRKFFKYPNENRPNGLFANYFNIFKSKF